MPIQKEKENFRVDAASDLLKAMASPHRLILLCTLQSGEKSVSELLASVPLSQPALSQHLAVLRHQGLVQSRREGQCVFYQLSSGPARSLIRDLYEAFCTSVNDQQSGKKR